MDSITREEQYLEAVATQDASDLPEPFTREEQFLYAAATGQTENLPDPETRTEAYLQEIAESGGGGSSVTVESLSVTDNGTYTAPEGTAYSPVTVNVSGGGVEAKDVNFIDYDGTILHAYTAQEFAALDALPSNPSHDGLTAQGWNWELAAAKTYVASYGKLWIGQMYVTTSGATEIDIELSDLRKSPYLGIGINGTVSIDWGDGSTADTVTGGNQTITKYTKHDYEHGGTYTIKITPAEGTTFQINGNQTSGAILLWGADGSPSVLQNRLYQETILAVRIGTGINNISSYAFQNCYALSSITIPSSVTSIMQTSFQDCHSLASISIPSSVTSIGQNAFKYCYFLKSASIPSGTTSIGSSAFQNCYVLKSALIPSGTTSIGSSMFETCHLLDSSVIPSGVTSIGSGAFKNCYDFTTVIIPSSVTSIGTYVFSYCYGLKEIHLLPATPPTLTNSNTFGNTQSDLVFYVPAGKLEDYKTATIWATWADQMQEEPS